MKLNSASPRGGEENPRNRAKAMHEKSKKKELLLSTKIEEDTGHSDKKTLVLTPKKPEGESDADEGSPSDTKRTKSHADLAVKKGIRKTDGSYFERKKAYSALEGDSQNLHLKQTTSQKMKNVKTKAQFANSKTSGQQQQPQQQQHTSGTSINTLRNPHFTVNNFI